jgi:hypothetical protein
MSIRPHIAVAVCVLMVVFVSACGGGATKSSLAVYEDAPTLNPVDVGKPGKSPGDAYYFFANLRDQLGGPVTGHLYGMKTLIKPEDPSTPNAEQRATLLFFVFDKSQDQIVVAGVPDYPPNAPEFGANQPVCGRCWVGPVSTTVPADSSPAPATRTVRTSRSSR